jgi:hypothetical protein
MSQPAHPPASLVISVIYLAGAPKLLARSLSETLRCALDRLAGPQLQLRNCERQIRR